MVINATALAYKQQGFDAMKGPQCPYCGKHSILRSNDYVYGNAAVPLGKVWVCSGYPACDSYVGVHRSGQWKDYPLGRLANAELRTAKKVAHNVFDLLWKDRNGVKRQEAYAWLAQSTGLPLDECHIGEMNLIQCNMVYVMAMRKLQITEQPIEDI